MPPATVTSDGSKRSFHPSNYRLRYVFCLPIRKCAKLISWFNLISSVAFLFKVLWARYISDLHPQPLTGAIFVFVFFTLILLGVHSYNPYVLYHVFLFYKVNIIQATIIYTTMLLTGEESLSILDNIEYRTIILVLAYIFYLLTEGFFVMVYYSLYVERRQRRHHSELHQQLVLQHM